MIRTLRRRFVLVSMAAITALLLLLLGVLNILNTVTTLRRTDETLLTLSDIYQNEPPEKTPAPSVTLPPVPENITPSESDADTTKELPSHFFFGFGTQKNDYDTFMSYNFFLVRFDEDGTALSVDTERTSAVTDEEALSLAADVLSAGEVQGKLGKFRYRVVTAAAEEASATVVFLDISNEMQSILRTLLLSAVVGLLCWLAMLLLVLLLSEKAISPLAENIEKQKQFITNAGHEIKTPLAIIQSNTEALELYTGESKWSHNIKEQTRRLSDLMQNLLRLSRMDEGIVRTQPTEVNLSELTRTVAESFSQPLADRQMTVTQRLNPDLTLFADRSQLEQLLSILLDNAVKYGSIGSTLLLTLTRTGKRTVLCVENATDTLPDVTPEKLFDRFYRGDAARTQKNGGYGIGLSMAYSIVTGMRGKIRATYLPGEENRIRFTVIL